ncbi:uncharacterized protein LOC130943360 [Arachis stenosperma]|uniref:uncharacterized protein LOC130943360 n=1 Tax=Arachis stenosperma TaxID=217475 RepID=UPI0025ACCD21|nr:uncharacterized protein LOC130943360 [Arachis stenosperma]
MENSDSKEGEGACWNAMGTNLASAFLNTLVRCSCINLSTADDDDDDDHDTSYHTFTTSKSTSSSSNPPPNNPPSYKNDDGGAIGKITRTLDNWYWYVPMCIQLYTVYITHSLFRSR